MNNGGTWVLERDTKYSIFQILFQFIKHILDLTDFIQGQLSVDEMTPGETRVPGILFHSIEDPDREYVLTTTRQYSSSVAQVHTESEQQ